MECPAKLQKCSELAHLGRHRAHLDAGYSLTRLYHRVSIVEPLCQRTRSQSTHPASFTFTLLRSSHLMISNLHCATASRSRLGFR